MMEKGKTAWRITCCYSIGKQHSLLQIYIIRHVTEMIDDKLTVYKSQAVVGETKCP